MARSAAVAPVLAQRLDRPGAPVPDLDPDGRPLDLTLDPRHRLLPWRPEYGHGRVTIPLDARDEDS